MCDYFRGKNNKIPHCKKAIIKFRENCCNLTGIIVFECAKARANVKSRCVLWDYEINWFEAMYSSKFKMSLEWQTIDCRKIVWNYRFNDFMSCKDEGDWIIPLSV